MRISVLGNGSLGCVLAAYLSRAGHEVSVLARAERLVELRNRPIRVQGLAEFDAPVSWVGELDAHSRERADAVARAFTEAGLPAEARGDIRGVEWSKLCQYAGAALVAAAGGASLHRIYQDADLARIYLAIIREAAAVAR